MKTFVLDWKRTLYDPDGRRLVDGASELLELLEQKGVRLVLVGKGSREMHEEVDRLGVRRYFEHINFIDGSKHPALFEPFVDPDSPADTIFVGDRVRSELAAGKDLGATTVWIRQGRFASEEPESPAGRPGHVFASLKELKQFLERSRLLAD